MKRILSILGVVVLFSSNTAGQSVNRNDFSRVLRFVSDAGAPAGYTIRQFIDTMRAQKFSTHEMVYGIYTWIGQHIEYNTSAERHPGRFSNTASAAYNNKYASSEGYANLFKAMCDVAKINCIIVKGIGKTHPAHIGKVSEKKNTHYWNMVNIENTWYNIDVSWGAGTTDEKMRTFAKDFTDAWFYTNNDLFQLSHYTNDRKIPVASTGITKSVFTNAPIIYSAAVVFEIYPPQDMKGKLKGKQKATVPLSLKVKNPTLLKSVMVQTTTEKIIPAYNLKDQTLTIEVPLLLAGKQPIAILINGSKALGFTTEVKKTKEKKPANKPVKKANKKQADKT